MLIKRSRRWLHQNAGEVVILDNRDSFVFNLAHRFYELGVEPVVVRSDTIGLEELAAWDPCALVLSPGPGHPRQAGVSVAAVSQFSGQIPILGICLGHQAVGAAFGARVEPSGRPVHGKASTIKHDGQGLFAALSGETTAARYHSLVVLEPLPDVLCATAWVDGYVMALKHRQHLTFGLQFHPESILSNDGYAILNSFLDLIPQ